MSIATASNPIGTQSSDTEETLSGTPIPREDPLGEPCETEQQQWPDRARSFIGTLRRALRICSADKEYYAGLLAERALEIEEVDILRDRVESLEIENHGLRGECEALRRAILATSPASADGDRTPMHQQSQRSSQ